MGGTSLSFLSSYALPPFDLSAQFALMFTTDLPGSLAEIHGALRPGGLLVGTVWEEFHILPLLRATMTEVLGQEPPPPPINPLSLKDRCHGRVPGLRRVFDARPPQRNRQIDINIGPMDHEDTIRTCLIPVMPSLSERKRATMATTWSAPQCGRARGDRRPGHGERGRRLCRQNVHVQVFCRAKSESEIPLDLSPKSACFLGIQDILNTSARQLERCAAIRIR